MTAQIKDTRAILRLELRQKRRNLNLCNQRLIAQSVTQRLLRHPWFKKAVHIGFYWPSDGEVSPLFLLKSALSIGKICYLPAISTKDNSMVFKRYRNGDKLKKNLFRIPEPLISVKAKQAIDLDLVLMPLVAVDAKGTRLGMGGGYYDRALEKSRARKPKLIGLAHEFQCVANLPRKKWDVPMQAVVTNKRVICF